MRIRTRVVAVERARHTDQDLLTVVPVGADPQLRRLTIAVPSGANVEGDELDIDLAVPAAPTTISEALAEAGVPSYTIPDDTGPVAFDQDHDG